MVVDMVRLAYRTFPHQEELWSDLCRQSEMSWSMLSSTEQSVMEMMLTVGKSINECEIATC